MTNPVPPTARPALPRDLYWLAASSGALVLAIVLAPFPMAAIGANDRYPSVSGLGESLGAGLVRFFSDGNGAPTPDLSNPVEYWARFHIVKACLAAALLLILILLGRQLYRSLVDADRPPRRVLMGGLTVVHGTLSVVALLMVVANIQGAIAPLSSALGLLPVGSAADPALLTTTDHIRVGLESGAPSPALEALVYDFRAYHAAMAIIGSVLTLGLLAWISLLWLRRSRVPLEQTRHRRVLVVVMSILTLFMACFGITTAANVSTVANPAPALLGFLTESG